MKILALETSTQAGSVALLVGDTLTERPVTGRPGHSETLLPATMSLLRECGVTLAEMDAIAFGAGPGAFTGLRLACGVAQGLALGAGKPVIPVSNLEALASQCPGEALFIAIDARMSEVYFAAYRRSGEALRELAPPQCASPEAVRLPEEGHWAGFGSAFQAYRDVLVNALGARLDSFDCTPQPAAGAIARLAAQRFEKGEAIDPVLAAPLYVRDKVALTTEERLARGGKA